MRYRLRTLLILLAIVPACVGMIWWCLNDRIWMTEATPFAQSAIALAMFIGIVIPVAFALGHLAGLVVKNRRIGD